MAAQVVGDDEKSSGRIVYFDLFEELNVVPSGSVARSCGIKPLSCSSERSRNVANP
jgi:hypothetical protein